MFFVSMRRISFTTSSWYILASLSTPNSLYRGLGELFHLALVFTALFWYVINLWNVVWKVERQELHKLGGLQLKHGKVAIV